MNEYVKNLKNLFNRQGHVCPWWLAYSWDNGLRKWIHKPDHLFAPYLKQGMTAIDIGCGMGYFSIGMARQVGEEGLVISVDLQQQMLDISAKRASASNVDQRIRFHKCNKETLGLNTQADFILTFWVAHEVRPLENFMKEIHDLLKPGGIYFLAEPLIHVPYDIYEKIASYPPRYGLQPIANPSVFFSRATVFRKET